MLQLARPEDWETVSEMFRQMLELHIGWRPDIYEPTDQPYPKAFFLEDIKNRSIYVAKIGNVIAGCVRFCISETNGPGNVKRKVLEIDEICVDELFRHQGIGKAIMEDVNALAKAFGCTDMQLSVYPQNDAAVSFYQKCGFMIRNINMQKKI